MKEVHYVYFNYRKVYPSVDYSSTGNIRTTEIIFSQ